VTETFPDLTEALRIVREAGYVVGDTEFDVRMVKVEGYGPMTPRELCAFAAGLRRKR
jgi:hypothetical protein